MYPRCIFQFTRLVQVQYQVTAEHITRVIAHHHRAPRSLARGLHRPLQAGSVGSEVTHKGHHLGQRIFQRLRRRGIDVCASAQLLCQVLRLRIHQLQVHRGVIHTRCLVDVDIQPVIGLHLQRRLHSGGRKHRHRRVLPVHCLLVKAAYLAQPAFLYILLLRVVVAGNPERLMVAGHSKFCHFLLYQKIVQILLLWELVAEPYSVVIHTESDYYPSRMGLEPPAALSFAGRHAGCLPVASQRYLQFVIVVADVGRLAPHRLPRLVEGARALALYLEAVHQVGLFHAHRRVLILGKHQAQMRRFHHHAALVAHLIRGATIAVHPEFHSHVAIRRRHLSRLQQKRYHHQ